MTARQSNRRGKPLAPRGRSYDPDLPVAGFYRVRLRKGGPPCALEIWHGHPLDPDTGEEMDRAPRWLARLNGVEFVHVFKFWPLCARQQCTREFHDRLAAKSRTMDPASPYFDPLRPIDLATVPLPLGKD